MTEHKPVVDGLRCPACHCRHMPVVFTRHSGSITVRVRQCRHCGRRVRTTERVVSDLGDDKFCG